MLLHRNPPPSVGIGNIACAILDSEHSVHNSKQGRVIARSDESGCMSLATHPQLCAAPFLDPALRQLARLSLLLPRLTLPARERCRDRIGGSPFPALLPPPLTAQLALRQSISVYIWPACRRLCTRLRLTLGHITALPGALMQEREARYRFRVHAMIPLYLPLSLPGLPGLPLPQERVTR